MCIRDRIKTIKRKITDLDKMKIEEQKKAVRSGYDMDIIPSDLATFGNEAKNLLQDLQSRNERMFLLTFLVVNMADTKRKLENDIFAAAGIAQKYNCALTRLDYQQEAGLMSIHDQRQRTHHPVPDREMKMGGFKMMLKKKRGYIGQSGASSCEYPGSCHGYSSSGQDDADTAHKQHL